MTSLQTIQLVMLPGIAADRRLFAAQRERFPNLIVPEWPAAINTIGTIDDASVLAERCWADWTVGNALCIDSDQPFMLCGTSSGGLMALEIAWHAAKLGKPPAAVLLISSCRNWQAVPRWYGRWADWSSKLPRWLANKLFVSRHVTQSLRSDAADRATAELVEAMYQASDFQQLQYWARRMSTWRREESELAAANFPIHQLHGRLDSLLPKPSPQHATLLLNAGHWMTATHADTVNNWIEAIIRDLSLKRRGPKPT